MRSAFGEFLQKKRESIDLSMRGLALKIGMDVSFYSRIERGEVPPPGEGPLTNIAAGLGIRVLSTEWEEMTMLADIARGEIPGVVREDEELYAMLPAFFARVRSIKAADAGELYDRLVEMRYEAKMAGKTGPKE